MSVHDTLARQGPRKLLALDGGGVHGLITIEVLARIESLLQAELGRDDRFVLADYFDYIGGTSTGAIIAACLALGLKVERVRKLYTENGTRIFSRAPWFKRHLHKFRSDELQRILQETLGADRTLGCAELKTLLLIVLRNATTASPWPVSNNPNAMFNQPELDVCNLKLPLWQLVRASTAAPTFFPPEMIVHGPCHFDFVDGGVSTYHNPAFHLFLMATLKAYRLNWPTGEDKMLLVSVGSGAESLADEKPRALRRTLLDHIRLLPLALFTASVIEQDLLCRAFGRCVFGDDIDLEVGSLMGDDGEGAVSPKLFTYVRYDVELTPSGLKSVGLEAIDLSKIRGLDSIRGAKELRLIGEATADKKVRKEHFAGFLK
jgi:predicted acylesterase/phospholipase RssA